MRFRLAVAHPCQPVSIATPPPAKPPRPPTRQPLLWLAIAYSAGLIIGTAFWRPPVWWLIAIAVFSASAIFFLRRRPIVALSLALSVSFFLGAFTIQATTPIDSPHLPPSVVDGDEDIITAHVIREGRLQNKGRGEVVQKLDLETEQIASEQETLNLRLGIRATFYSKLADQTDSQQPLRVFHYGDRLRFPAKLSIPRNFRNPGAFDYRQYLAEKGIAALTSAKTSNVEVLPGFIGSRTELDRTRFHQNLIRQIERLWPEHQAALVEAMLIGENAVLEHDLLTDFQRTGTYHVLVISGLKVGILSLVMFWLLRAFRIREWMASLATVLLTIAYAVLTDVGVPVWRATMMLALYLCARALYRRRAVLNTIAIAALVLLCIDPAALAGASFQLSFLCVLIIAAIGSPLLERTTRPVASALRNWNLVSYDFALPPKLVQWRLDLRLIIGRLQRFLGQRLSALILVGGMRAIVLVIEFLVISYVIQIGFALPMAYYFHRATLVSLPANALAVPLTEIAMVASLFAVTFSYMNFAIAHVPAWIAGLSLDAMAGSVRWLGNLRIADARVATPSLTLIVAGSAALILAMFLARRHAALIAASLLALTATSFWICAVSPHPDLQPQLLEMTAIDVGEGDSILLVSPEGRTLLVDAGGIPRWMHSDLDIGEDVVSPYLWSRGFQHLDAVAVTHPHADHIGGMRAILANFHPRELWIATGPPNSEMDELLAKAHELGVQIGRASCRE